ncbi:MAG: ACP S-malonyltransferase [Candidatus Margulisbacteria bacterium]|nr:ACP S-malonyltransferase [Candidatus Margulisiibacteriota bacterium]
MKTAFIFPGQGSQFVGMGKSLLDANKDFFAEHRAIINEVCGASFLEIMLEGPIEELSLTFNTQPALFIASALVTDILKKARKTPQIVAGHSLGEYSALYAAGVFDFRTGLTLVKKRGEMMNKAVPAGVGTMAAVMGLDPEKIEAIVKFQGVEVANYNNSAQIIISGKKEDVLKCFEPLQSAGAKRVMELNVSGPFHSSLMRPMADEFSKIMDSMQFNNAVIPVVTNVDAEMTTESGQFKQKLVKQLYSSVYWMQSVEKMISHGVEKYVECGAGKVLAGISKRIAKDSEVLSIDNSEDLLKYTEG